jgi:uncharacterized protein (TIGR02118 family)
MIKVSVMYANAPGARFDHAYYRDTHMPMLQARLGDACRHYTIDRGITGGAPGQRAAFIAMCHVYCDSIHAFESAFAPHAAEIMADVANYTDLKPQIQISDVVVR